MATEVILPKVDMVMESGTFVEWLKQEGDPVVKGEPLFVIATDKSAIEIESPATGVLRGLRAKPNDVIPVTSVLAFIVATGETLPAESNTVASAAARPDPLSVEATDGKTRAGGATTPAPTTDAGNGKPRATPVARRMAAELGLDLMTIAGRGPRGRIHRADVLSAVEHRVQSAAPASLSIPAPIQTPLNIPLPNVRQKQVIPLSGPRRVIAERMAYSAATAPHITLTLSVDMTEAVRLRAQTRSQFEKWGLPLSFTAIIARAVAFVLTQHPFLNASFAGDKIILWQDVCLGIATSLEDYLIVPVIREAQNKNLREIAAALDDLVGRARSRRLTPAEMSGSTCTISNLGMYGIESFTSILNPPESAILSIGAIIEQSVVRQGASVIRPMMQVTVAADHRVVDGVMVARFLADVKNTLENPYLLI